MIKFCPECGTELIGEERFCSYCGNPLKSEDLKKFGSRMPVISILFGGIILLTIPVGWKWYLESELPLVLYCQLLSLLDGILLLLLGIFPQTFSQKLKFSSKENYMSAVIILIIIWFIIVGIEPEPPMGW